MTIYLRLPVLLLALLGCGGAPQGGVPEAVACKSCRIEMTPVLSIGDTAGPSILTGRPGYIVTDGRGRYWIGVLDAFPLLFDSASRTLREFAKEGEGPGEFRHPWIAAYLPGDSLLVRDMRGWVVLPASTGGAARTLSSSGDLGSLRVIRWPDLVVARSHPYRRGAGGQMETRYVVVAYDMSGSSVVGKDTLYATPWESGRDGISYANSLRYVGDADSSTVWVGNVNRYRLVRYTFTGEAHDSVIRQPRWFPGGEPMRMGGPNKPTTPHLINHWLDDAGRLWVLAAQPRTDTKEAWEGVAQGPGGGMAEVRVSALPAEYELNRTIIEVIDLEQKRVIARHTFEGYVVAVLPGDRVASFVETESGLPVLTIHQLRLVN